jgi:RNA polymerase sigma-70 factor (ECF subfamily)
MFVFGKSAAAAAVSDIVKPEALLVERICAGDADAFNEIYKMFAPLIHGVVLARVPREEAQDIVQEVFLAAYKSLHTLRDRNAVGPWLVRIARNLTVEYYRRAKPADELPETLGGKQRPSAEAAEALRAIRSLPEAYSETLVLRLIEGMSGNEIAEATGLKPESVRVNLHRGMEMLRQKLGVTGVRK